MLGISRRDKLGNERIRAEAGVRDVMDKVTRLKWKWAGHVARMRPERWSKSVTERTPWERKRMRGGRRRRQRDELVEKAGTGWMPEARERNWLPRLIGSLSACHGQIG